MDENNKQPLNKIWKTSTQESISKEWDFLCQWSYPSMINLLKIIIKIMKGYEDKTKEREIKEEKIS